MEESLNSTEKSPFASFLQFADKEEKMPPIIFENESAQIITTAETIKTIKRRKPVNVFEEDVKSETGPSATTNHGVPSQGETE